MIIQVITHEGEVFDMELDGYNAAEMNEKLNDSEVNTVVIGNNIFSRFDIKRIVTK